jgi:hypothetical protein
VAESCTHGLREEKGLRTACVKLYCFVSDFIVLCPTLLFVHTPLWAVNSSVPFARAKVSNRLKTREIFWARNAFIFSKSPRKRTKRPTGNKSVPETCLGDQNGILYVSALEVDGRPT